MGLFGLSTSEAILLTRQLNQEQERRKDETLRAINKQTQAAEQQAKANNKAKLEAIGQLGRKARLMEYDPKYCDVIIARWEKLTGEKATKLNL